MAALARGKKRTVRRMNATASAAFVDRAVQAPVEVVHRALETLLLLRQAALPLEAVVFAKLLAHWLLTALPLLVASPLLAILLSMDMDVWARTALALLLGTPALAAFGAVGAAVTVGLRRGGLLGPVLMLPLSVPVLIFGAGAIAPGSGDAALLFLAALSLVSVAFCPFAAALALRVGSE